MFDIGFTELVVIGVVALVVLGPERLPKAARFAGLWVRRARAQWHSVRDELERELAADEIKRSVDQAKQAVNEAEQSIRTGGESLRGDAEQVRDEVKHAVESDLTTPESAPGNVTEAPLDEATRKLESRH